MATGKEFVDSVAYAGRGIQSTANKAFESIRGVLGGGAGAGKSVLGGIAGFALDLLSAPFKAIGDIGTRHPRLAVVAAAAATLVGFSWWKSHRKEKTIDNQIENERKISAELQKTEQMMQEAYGLVTAQQQQMQPNQWQSRIGGERSVAAQQAEFNSGLPR